MNNIDRIFYINLDHRIDRLTEISHELSTHLTPQHYSEKVERYPAIKCDNGAMGCSMSHLEVLKIAKARKYRYIIILEDDFQFLIGIDELYAQLANVFATDSSSLLDFKVIMLSYNALNAGDCGDCGECRDCGDCGEYNDFLSKTTNVQTTAGYLLNCAYIDQLLENYTKGIQLFKETGEHWKYAIDQYWKKEQNDKWFIFKTRIGKQRP